MQVEARVACWAERFAYVGLQGAVEAALLSMAVLGTAAFNAHCEALFKVPAFLTAWLFAPALTLLQLAFWPSAKPNEAA